MPEAAPQNAKGVHGTYVKLFWEHDEAYKEQLTGHERVVGQAAEEGGLATHRWEVCSALFVEC
jgi:hypothetical protein